MKANHQGKLINLIAEDAVMLPTKMLIFLQPNTRVSGFDIMNFLFTFLSLSSSINNLVFEFDVIDFNCPNFLQQNLIAVLMIIGSQLAVIIVFLTFYGFFSSHGLSMSENYVQ
jgi:hypothetical protein